MRIDLYEQGGYSGGGITENGGNISGPLVLAGNPSQTLEAVPKQYVDAYFYSLNANNFGAGTINAARLPAFAGDLTKAAGSTTLSLANSGVTAGSYAKITVNSKGIVTAGSALTESDIPTGIDWSKINSGTLPSNLSGYGILDAINVSGGTLTGFLTLNQSPSSSNHAVTKQYVDSLVVNGGISVGDILRKPYTTTPTGFLRCNGGEVDKTTFASLYAIIGDNFSSSIVPGGGKPWVQQYHLNAQQNGDISGWVSAGNFPDVIHSVPMAVTKNKVYKFGGASTNNVLYSSVYYATVSSDGTLGTWTNTTGLPTIVSSGSAFVIKNRMYLLGGHNGSTYISSVFSAQILADGSLGTWITEQSFPIGIVSNAVLVTKNRLHVVGGQGNAGILANTWSATINTDGTIGSWVAGKSLPRPVYSPASFFIKDRFYIVGGYGASGVINTVYYATVKADGTLSDWILDNPLPVSIYATSHFATKNRVYLMGGYDGSTWFATCWGADINSDGSLGTWTQLPTSLPTNIGSAGHFLVNGKFYIIGGGGNGNNWLQSIYMANVNAGMNDYSPYYDGTILPASVTDGSNSFFLPDFTADEPFGSYSFIKY